MPAIFDEEDMSDLENSIAQLREAFDKGDQEDIDACVAFIEELLRDATASDRDVQYRTILHRKQQDAEE